LARARRVNPEAYEAYLKGRSHWYKLTPLDLETALQNYELALEKDPDYALAYSGIALVWQGRQQLGFVPPREATPRAKAAVLKALELDSTLAEAHELLAIIRIWSEWDWEGGEMEFRRAIALNPNYPDVHAFYSAFLDNMGRPKEGTVQIERALALDPFNPLFQSLYGWHLMCVRRVDEAIAQLRNTLRTVPDHPLTQWGLRQAFHQKGMYEEALEEWKAAARGDREVEEALERGYAEAGYTGAMSLAAETLAARSGTTYVAPTLIAELYACAGKNDRAFEWLEKGLEARDPNLPLLNVHTSWDSLRDDPRFQDLLRRMNLPEREQR